MSLPTSSTGSNPVARSLTPPDLGVSSEESSVEKLTGEAALRVLPPPTTSSFSYFKPWTWWKKAEGETSAKPERATEQLEKESDSKISGSPEKEQSNLEQESVEEEPLLGEEREPESSPSAAAAPLESPVLTSEIPEGKREISFEETTQKTAQMGNRWWRTVGSMGSAMQSVASFTYSTGSQVIGKGWGLAKMGGEKGFDLVKASGSKALQTYANYYAGHLDKSNQITQAHQRMRNAVSDPEFIEFSTFMTTFLQNVAQDALPKEGWIAGNLSLQQQLLKDLIEINMAKGFANLAEQVCQNKRAIPNYDKQPALVSVLSLLCSKTQAHVTMEKLAQIEEKYREKRVFHRQLLQELFPDLSEEPEKQKMIQGLINGSVNEKQALNGLFPDLVGMTDRTMERYEKQRGEDLESGMPDLKERMEALNQFVQSVASEKARHEELNQMMKAITEDILIYLFPNKVNDLVVPSVLKVGYVQNWIYNHIKNQISTFLQESYEPLEDNPVRRQGWESALKSRVGSVQTQTFIEAPAAFLTGFGKNYIQSDPHAVELVAWALTSMSSSSAPSVGQGLDQASAKEKIVANLSKTELAGWLVQSAQALLHTEDPHLLNAGFFVKSVLSQLTLGLLAKGTNLAIPEGEQIKDNQFITELSNRILEKLKALQREEAISNEFWNDFVQDLPLPPFIKSLLVSKLMEKADSLKAPLLQASENVNEVQRHYQESVEKFKTYKNADQFLAITETITNQMVQYVLENNVDLVTTFGFGETVEELADQYLPGVKLDQDLKNWLKGNIGALGVEEGQTPASIILIKQGIQTVILKALSNTIEKNFQSNSEDYAAQLLKNLQSAMQKAFPAFSDEQKQGLREALAIQVQIKSNHARIASIKKMINNSPEGLKPEQLEIVQNLVRLDKRSTRAKEYVEKLENKRKEMLLELNGDAVNGEWGDEKLKKIRVALSFRQMIQQQLTEERADREDQVTELDVLRDVLNQLQAQQNSSEPGVSPEEKRSIEVAIENCTALVELLDLSEEELQLIAETLTIDKTLDQTRKELSYLEAEVRNAHRDFGENGLSLSNSENWRIATQWISQVLNGRKEIHQLVEENQSLEDHLAARLGAFQVLSNELTALIGLDQKDALELPPFLQERIWPLMESAKHKMAPPLLFDQISPMLFPIMEMEDNREKLQALSDGKNFLAELSHVAAEDIVKKIPDHVTSYKPFAKLILTTAGVSNPTQENIIQMEAALQGTMLQLGQEVMTANMFHSLLKDKVSAEQAEHLLADLHRLSQSADQSGVTKEAIFELLRRELSGNESASVIEKKAQELTQQINVSLINLGKTKLTADKIVTAYQAFTGLELSSESQVTLVHALKNGQVVEKIKKVIITPEEIARFINDAIPGATEIHALLAPQIQAVISGDDRTFEVNRDFAQQYVEAMLLRVFVKIAVANGEENILETLTGKLKNLAQNPALVSGKTREEAARSMINSVLEDIIGVSSKADLKGVPLALQELIYEKLKDAAYVQISPVLFPMIERTINEEKLNQLSASRMLSSLSKALTKDVFYLLPSGLNSYRAMAGKMLRELSGQEPSSEKLESLAGALMNLAKQSSGNNLSHQSLAEAYAHVNHLTLDIAQGKELVRRLKEKNYKKEIKNILTTSEQIASSLGEVLPHVTSPLQQSLADALHDLTRNETITYQNAANFAGQYVEGMLLRLFLKVAEKNPPTANKDSLVVLTERLLDLVTRQYQETKMRDFEEVAKELNDAVLTDVLGIDSKDALEGLPEPLKEVAFKSFQDVLGNMAVNMYKSIKVLDSSQPSIELVKQELQRFGVDQNTHRAYAEILAQDLGEMVISAVPHILTEIGGNKMRGVNVISRGVEDYLEELARGNIEVAKVLLNYSQAPAFQDLLGENLSKIADSEALVEDKQKAANLVSNLVLLPLEKVLSNAVAFESEQGAQFNRKLMANLLKVGTSHLKTLNLAKRLANEGGRSHIAHADFVRASTNLHPAVPKTAISYQRSLGVIKQRLNRFLDERQLLLLEQSIRDLIKAEEGGKETFTIKTLIAKIQEIKGEDLSNETRQALEATDLNGKTLRDLVREDARAIRNSRQEEFYDPTTKLLLKMLFPNGKKDLLFIPENLRGQTWKALKKNLFPMMLPLVMESVLDQVNLKKMILSSLENAKETLDREIVLDSRPEENPNFDELDAVSGELIAELLETVELPNWIRKKLKDPVTGEINPAMAKSMGASLRKQFNDTFIKDKLEMALKTAVQRDENDNSKLKFDPSSALEKETARMEENERLDASIKRALPEVVDSSISYFVRSTWKQAQAKFDQAVERVFGKVGRKIKHALDAVFNFVFFKIMGTALSFLFSPLKGWVKHKFYDYLMLDQNREALMERITHKPEDQPVDSNHIVYHEDLAYKAVQAMRRTIEEVMNNPLPLKRPPLREPNLVA